MFIYKIENLINGKVYIGQTRKSPKQRWKEHQQSALANDQRHIYQAIRKYGVSNFQFSVVCSALSSEHLDALEELLIAQYNSFTAGYNMTSGGKCFALVGRANTWSAKAVETRKKNGHSFASRTSKFELLHKNGTVVQGENLTAFCREHDMSIGNLWRTFYGTRKWHKEYKLVRTFND